MKLIFVFGAATSPEEQKSIDTESRQYRDIIQIDVVDSYKNLSYKVRDNTYIKYKVSTNSTFSLKAGLLHTRVD